MKERKLLNYLFLAALFFLAAIGWVCFSFYLELSCEKPNGWFSKSGAILVVVALWFGQVARPFITEFTFPDLVEIYKRAGTDKPAPEEHWAVKYRIVSILLKLELFLAIVGTLIWAYSDSWLPLCTK